MRHFVNSFVLVTAVALLLLGTPQFVRAQWVAEPAEEPSVVLQQVSFTGNTIFTEEELYAVVGDALGRSMTVEDLEALAQRVTRYYRDAGYFLAQAYLPPQQIEEGVVEIAVLEGRYSRLDLRNKSRLNDEAAERLLGAVRPGTIIERRSLQGTLEWFAQTPGVSVASTLAPGDKPGSSELIVEIEDEPAFSGSLGVDNAGSRLTGLNRVLAAARWANPSGRGDEVSLTVVSGGEGLASGGLAYAVPMVWDRPHRLTGYASSTRYTLGQEFTALEANGTAHMVGLAVDRPIFLSNGGRNLLRLELEHKRLTDSVMARETKKVGLLGVLSFIRETSGRVRQKLAATLTLGNLRVVEDDLGAASHAGGFGKLNVDLARSQPMAGGILSAVIRGQMASGNLDASESFSLGGMDGVRAYPSGEASGDEGLLARVEWRHIVAETKFGEFESELSVDGGWSRAEKHPDFNGAGENERSLYGAGVGLNWTVFDTTTLTLEYARRLSRDEATTDVDRGGRIWAAVSWTF